MPLYIDDLAKKLQKKALIILAESATIALLLCLLDGIKMTELKVK